jgi:hypothetical protein
MPRVHVIAGLLCSAVLTVPAFAASNAQTIPDFSGTWARPYIGFEPPPSGPGPLKNLSRDSTDHSNLSEFVGDYENPILKPEAANAVRKHGELERKGIMAPNPSNQCLPMSPPYILQRQEIQLIQRKDEITILYNEDQQIRRVRLDAEHPSRVAPSWYGDSVGRFEGDTLIVDTVGIKVGPHSMIDSFGTPYTEALHLVERYRFIDYDAAKGAAARSETENRRLLADSFTGNGVGIDTEYKGKSLQVTFTVEDTNVFTMPWSGVSTYWRAQGDWTERICAENTREFGGRNLPTANKPDF